MAWLTMSTTGEAPPVSVPSTVPEPPNVQTTGAPRIGHVKDTVGGVRTKVPLTPDVHAIVPWAFASEPTVALEEQPVGLALVHGEKDRPSRCPVTGVPAPPPVFCAVTSTVEALQVSVGLTPTGLPDV